MTVKCPACDKTFAFDPTQAPDAHLGPKPPGGQYFPCCAHCQRRLTVTPKPPVCPTVIRKGFPAQKPSQRWPSVEAAVVIATILWVAVMAWMGYSMYHNPRWGEYVPPEQRVRVVIEREAARP